MKIAIIGSGISGLTCGWLLSKLHDIELFESEARIGGHTATVDVQHDGESHQIDTGFIVYNDWTYPNFIALLKKLEIKTQKSNMSFSVMRDKTDFEYSGSSFSTLFSQKKNFFKPSFLKMLLDIKKFNAVAIDDLKNNRIISGLTLKSYLLEVGVGTRFVRDYLVPMGSAIWSSSNKDIMNFPALFFLNFFKNHGLLNIKNRPQWYVITGGSREYLAPLSQPFKEKIHTNSKISSVTRIGGKAQITFNDGSQREFDQVVFACHSDQALRLIKDPTPREQDILGAIHYKTNQVVLHTDTKLMPRKRMAWASWNYRLSDNEADLPILSYYMNKLQSLKSDTDFFVTLNATGLIDPKKIVRIFHYAHPQFTLATEVAQSCWQEINGVNGTWFCGAYWGSGFHEDGCTSGIRVAKALGAQWTL